LPAFIELIKKSSVLVHIVVYGSYWTDILQHD
jgi:hypothetical protein